MRNIFAVNKHPILWKAIGWVALCILAIIALGQFLLGIYLGDKWYRNGFGGDIVQSVFPFLDRRRAVSISMLFWMLQTFVSIFLFGFLIWLGVKLIDKIDDKINIR